MRQPSQLDGLDTRDQHRSGVEAFKQRCARRKQSILQMAQGWLSTHLARSYAGRILSIVHTAPFAAVF